VRGIAVPLIDAAQERWFAHVLTPSWKFKRVTVNPTGTLAAASRDRTHDLQITMGPGDSAGLKGPAANAQLAGDVGLSVANGIKTLVLP
jgi:hypothetical protein